MATKAQQFKAEMERVAQAIKRAGKPAKTKRRNPRRKDRIPNQASHNEAPSRTRKSSYAFEVAATARPSRKSTRKSSNRQKTDSGLRIAAMKRNASPESRASRRSGNPN
jgi:hypothetical protein